MKTRHIMLLLAATALAPCTEAGCVPTVIRWHGKGVQIYSCGVSHDGYAWKLIRPDATLIDSRGIARGHHGAGPSWTAADGSRIVGIPVTQIPAPQPDAIPWLVLRVETQEGQGVLRGMTYVLRTETVGGMPPTGCDAVHAGTEIQVPYQAIYTFLHSADLPGSTSVQPSSR
jgi:hypothetical protein